MVYLDSLATVIDLSEQLSDGLQRVSIGKKPRIDAIHLYLSCHLRRITRKIKTVTTHGKINSTTFQIYWRHANTTQITTA